MLWRLDLPRPTATIVSINTISRVRPTMKILIKAMQLSTVKTAIFMLAKMIPAIKRTSAKKMKEPRLSGLPPVILLARIPKM
jgi:hypothetical protein